MLTYADGAGKQWVSYYSETAVKNAESATVQRVRGLLGPEHAPAARQDAVRKLAQVLSVLALLAQKQV